VYASIGDYLTFDANAGVEIASGFAPYQFMQIRLCHMLGSPAAAIALGVLAPEAQFEFDDREPLFADPERDGEIVAISFRRLDAANRSG